MDAKRHLAATLTVKKLIEQLQNCDPDLPVVFAYPARDYWHNELACGISSLDDEQIEFSDYHRTFKTLGDNAPDKDTELYDVLVLR